SDVTFPGLAALGGAGTVLISYRLFDDESDPTDLEVSFRRNPDQPWTRASEFPDIFHSGRTGLRTSPDGVTHEFRWDTRGTTTSGFAEPLELRLRVTDGREGNPISELFARTASPIGSAGLDPLAQTLNVDAGNNIESLLAHDFDEDGQDEIVVGVFGATDGFLYYRPNSAGVEPWAPVETFGRNDSAGTPRLAQVDGTGPMEIIVDHRDTAVVYRYESSDFVELATVGKDSAVGIQGNAIADFDGDGQVDWLFVNDDDGCTLFRGNPDATRFDLTGENFSCGAAVNDETKIPVLDINRDGVMDFALPDVFSETLNVYLGTRDGLPSFLESTPIDRLVVTTAVDDFDGDGNVDIALFGFFSQTVAFVSPNADGSGLGPLRFVPSPVGAQLPAVGDLNGDGRPDFVTVASIDRALSLSINRSTPGVLQFDTQRTVDLTEEHQFLVLAEGSSTYSVVTAIDPTTAFETYRQRDEAILTARSFVSTSSAVGWRSGLLIAQDYDFNGTIDFLATALGESTLLSAPAEGVRGVSVAYPTTSIVRSPFANDPVQTELNRASFENIDRAVVLNQFDFLGISSIELMQVRDDGSATSVGSFALGNLDGLNFGVSGFRADGDRDDDFLVYSTAGGFPGEVLLLRSAFTNGVWTPNVTTVEGAVEVDEGPVTGDFDGDGQADGVYAVDTDPADELAIALDVAGTPTLSRYATVSDGAFVESLTTADLDADGTS
ncbi:MAG: VCBS repeat-containing protein, partial [Myxococcota bacterium]